jgi:nucleoside-diphosphate-sugar epimerase
LPDVVISGAGGFIGGHLAAAFTARGLAVSDYRAFRDGRDVADTFIHCANVQDNPVENARYTADVLATVGSRAKRFIQLQTFATLHGLGSLDARAFNFGKTPLLMAPYPLGKLLQEKVLCAHAQRHPALAIRLLYLPAVLGGGSWAKVIATAQRNGVLLPPLMHATARANHIDVDDIAAHLAATANDDAPGITRTILNRPDSANLDWRAFFAGAGVDEERSAQAIAKLAATTGALAAYRVMTTIKLSHVPDGEIDQRAPRPRDPQHADEDKSAEPVRFTGLIQYLVRTQPYIPPAS